MTFKVKNLTGVYLVPGMPHVLHPEKNSNYKIINEAMKSVSSEIKANGTERIIYYSTQWLSVLGLSFQGRSKINGKHVDENWHKLENLQFNFNVDRKFTESLSSSASRIGFQTSIVDYDHFPIDTATIVADKLVNSAELPVAMVASHVYSDAEKTKQTANAFAEVIAADEKKTAVVACSLLTTNYHSKMIDFADDSFSDPKSDQYCAKLIGSIESFGLANTAGLVSEIVANTRTDMGLKALSFLDGIALGLDSPARVLGYGCLYGAGGAVISFKG